MPEGRARILSAGVVVVRPENATWQFLLLRAYQYWDFPKGRTEPDETPKQAALREVAEETGITDLTFPWGDDYVETGPYARGKIARLAPPSITNGAGSTLQPPTPSPHRGYGMSWTGPSNAFPPGPRTRRVAWACVDRQGILDARRRSGRRGH
jgi:hypothetical protein